MLISRKFLVYWTNINISNTYFFVEWPPSSSSSSSSMGASLTLQEKRWWTARLRACFFRPTRVAEHLSHPATLRSDPPSWPPPGWALRRVPPLKGILKRSPTWRHLEDGVSSVLWHMFALPLEPPVPSGVGRSLTRQSPPVLLPVKPTGSRASEFWGHKYNWKLSANHTPKLLFFLLSTRRYI